MQGSRNSRCSEVRAAIAIQSHWRAFIVRRNIGNLVSACCVMQSGFRGHRGRKRARKLEARVRQNISLHCLASVITSLP